MPQTYSWSYSGGSPVGAGVNIAGKLEADAIVSAGVQLPKNMAADRELALQIDDVDKLAFLVVASSLYDGSVDVKADTVTRTKLTGPLILHGAAVKLFAANLDKVSLKNSSVAEAADIQILMGLELD
jgi:hypothetical protein